MVSGCGHSVMGFRVQGKEVEDITLAQRIMEPQRILSPNQHANRCWKDHCPLKGGHEVFHVSLGKVFWAFTCLGQ